MRAEISGVVPESIADELGLEKGDFLLSVNGVVPSDIIDFRYLSADQYLDVEIEKGNGEQVIFEVEKDEDEELGIIFDQNTFDGVKRCSNKCIFCFVEQMPPDLRKTLYLKDDDYRLSLLYGNFITLTNISQKELERIKRMRISPLYISVHSTDAGIRQKMLNHPRAGKVLADLAQLARAEIEMHTQIVLCPGINDGKDFEHSVRQLAELWPQVHSVAVVPVGITRFQKNPEVRRYTEEEARQIVEMVSQWQKAYRNRIGSNFVYLADEFYLMTGADIPSYDHYEGFPQIENGVGLVRFFWYGFDQAAAKLPSSLPSLRKVTLVTGQCAGSVLRPIRDRLNQTKNLLVELEPIPNSFFGPTVTVAGLLTGSDLISGLDRWRTGQNMACPEILIPSTMLKYGEQVFLDGKTVDEAARALKVKVTVVEPRGEALISAVLGADFSPYVPFWKGEKR